MQTTNTGRYFGGFNQWLYIGIIALATQSAQAQVNLILSAGSTHFLGDLGGSFTNGTPSIADLNLQGTRYMGGLGMRVNLGKTIALRAGGYYGRLAASDKYTTNPARRNRNLDFFSPIQGGNLILELKLLPNKQKFHKLYIFGGIEYFHFDPRTHYNGRVVRLQPLGTEGQFFMPGKSPYKLTSLAIPFGFGFNFLSSTHGYWSFELSSRKTFTDYIDDVSTNYVDKTQLLASNGQTAVDLSDRSLGEIPGFSAPGAIRGKPTYTDNFFFLCINYNIILGGKNAPRTNGKRERRLAPGKNSCYQF